MLEKKTGMAVQDGLADVVEKNLRRLEHICSHRPERQLLDIVTFDGREVPGLLGMRHHFGGR